MSFPTYPEYKDSGVEWLGEVPSHWQTIPLRHLTECLDGKRIPLNAEQRAERQGNVPYWGANCIMDYVNEALFDEELILLGEDGAPFFDKTRSVAFTSQGPVWPNNHIHVLRPLKKISATFIAFSLNATDFAEYIDGSTRDKLTQNQMSRIPIAFPPAEERKVIASFLDHETTKIDALIAEQETLIELLKEKRQAVISHAVTKGLDPNEPKKDSGVAWLGDVPTHWGISPIKHAIRSIEQGWSPQCENFPVEGDEEWGVLKVGCVNGGKFNPLENKALPKELEPQPSLGLLAGDVLISRANTKELVGSAAVVDTNRPRLLLCDKLYRLRTHTKQLLPVYLVMLLGTREARSIIELSATGASSSMQNIGQSTILELEIPLPSIDEQESIVHSAHKQCEPLETLLAEAQHAITLLKERRSALISAAVTGKIDVRGYAPQPEAA